MEIILITGGAGFIGSNLIKFILKRRKSIQIYSLDNYSSGKRSNHINSSKVKYLKGSTLDLNKNKNLLKIKFDKVYHFAEYSRIVPSFVDYELCLMNNNFGTLEVIKFCLKNNAKLIYSASSSTIGKNKNLSPYSWSKYSSNELIKNFSKWFGLKYVIVYFYNVYGNNQILNGKMAAVIGIFEDQYKSGKPLTIVKPGTQKRDFTHVNDIVNGTYLASTKAINDEFHIGSGKNYKLIDIVKMFKSKYIYVEERPGERFYSLSSSNKAKRILNYKPKYTLKEYIKKFINKNNNNN
ncbi:NAD-dependent epimerase/dehydratase family protein [Alphaproteobacteria bacterium]|nr:NAD-dependent epimerase/dehydratase family protein [Alphaproteobacteria bacterium]